MTPALLEFLQRAVLIGAGATLAMDVWALFLKRCFGIPSLNFAMVGRWIGHLPRGRFRHENIARAEPCLLYTSPSPRDLSTSRMPSSA